MPTTVEIKDQGVTVEFPDSMSPEDIRGVLRRKFGPGPRQTAGEEEAAMADSSEAASAATEEESKVQSPKSKEIPSIPTGSIVDLVKEPEIREQLRREAAAPDQPVFEGHIPELTASELAAAGQLKPATGGVMGAMAKSAAIPETEGGIVTMDSPLFPLGDMLLKETKAAKGPVEAGMLESLRPTLNGLTSRRNLAYMLGSMGVASTGRMGQKLVSALWTAVMGKDLLQETPETWRQLGEEMGKPEGERDRQKIAKLLTDTGTHAAMTIGPALHLAKGAEAEAPKANPLAEQAEAIRPVAPLTAAALEQQTSSSKLQTSENIQAPTAEVEKAAGLEVAGTLATEPVTEATANREIVKTHTLETAKREIESDMASGKVPSSVSSFSELQNYVDANEYINDAARADRRIGPLGKSLGWKTDDYIGFSNELIGELDKWLETRSLAAEAAPKQPTVAEPQSATVSKEVVPETSASPPAEVPAEISRQAAPAEVGAAPASESPKSEVQGLKSVETEEKGNANAVSEQSTDAGVLREEGSAVGLPAVGEGNAEPEVAAGKKGETGERVRGGEEEGGAGKAQKKGDTNEGRVNWARAYQLEHADLLEAQRRMEEAREAHDAEGEKAAKTERDDILQRLDTFDALAKTEAPQSEPTIEALRNNPRLTLAEAVTEGQRLSEQRKGDEAYDAALESGATKREAKETAVKAETPAAAAAKVGDRIEKIKQEAEVLAERNQKAGAKKRLDSAKAVKSELVERLEKAIEEAKKNDPNKPTFITVDIPGDGEFKVGNTPEQLTEVLDRAKRISTSSPSRPAKISVNRGGMEGDVKKAIEIYKTPEDAYRTVRRQAEALEDPEARQGAEKLAERIYDQTKASFAEAKADAAKQSARDKADLIDELSKQLEKLKKAKKPDKRRIEELEKLLADYSKTRDMFERSAKVFEADELRERKALGLDADIAEPGTEKFSKDEAVAELQALYEDADASKESRDKIVSRLTDAQKKQYSNILEAVDRRIDKQAGVAARNERMAKPEEPLDLGTGEEDNLKLAKSGPKQTENVERVQPDAQKAVEGSAPIIKEPPAIEFEHPGPETPEAEAIKAKSQAASDAEQVIYDKLQKADAEEKAAGYGTKRKEQAEARAQKLREQRWELQKQNAALHDQSREMFWEHLIQKGHWTQKWGAAVELLKQRAERQQKLSESLREEGKRKEADEAYYKAKQLGEQARAISTEAYDLLQKEGERQLTEMGATPEEARHEAMQSANMQMSYPGMKTMQELHHRMRVIEGDRTKAKLEEEVAALKKEFGILHDTGFERRVRDASSPERAREIIETQRQDYRARQKEAEAKEAAKQEAVKQAQADEIEKAKAIAPDKLKWTLTGGKGERVWQAVEGKPVALANAPELKFFVHRKNGVGWTVVEEQTGLRIGDGGKSQAEAIQFANERFSKTDPEQRQLMISKGTEGNPPKPDVEPSTSMRSKAAEGQEPPPQTAPEGPKIEGMGGAIPEEFAGGGTATGIKNATVDQERVKRGLPPAMEPARRSFGQVWDTAMAAIDKNGPRLVDDLIDSLQKKPRAVTDVEDALLLHRQIDLHNEYDRATRDLAQAQDDAKAYPDRLADAVEDKLRVARLSDELQALYDVTKKVGTETGRGLNARKMMAHEDFTLAKMELEARAARGGRQLTDAERAEITELHEKIAQAQQRYDEHVAASQERISKLEAQATIDRIKLEAAREGPAIHPKIIEIAERLVKQLDTRAEAARARIKARSGTMAAGVDPTVLLDVADIGASYLGHRVLDFAKWSDAMLKDVGEWIKPHLEEVFKASQKRVDDLTEKTGRAVEVKKALNTLPIEEQVKALGDKVKEKKDKGKLDEITWYVQRLARIFVANGVKEREALIDKVHEVIAKVIPDQTRRQTMDMISGYGDFRQLSKDQVSVQLRDLKGQMQQVGKLQDMQAKQAPLKTGVERRTPSDEERRLIKQVEEAKRRGGYTVTDPATQLRTSLQSMKTRLANEISDLEFQINSGQKLVKGTRKVTPDAEATALKARRDTLKEQFDDVFGKKGITDEQRVANAMRAVEKSIGEYERRIKEGDLSSQKQPSLTPETPELKAAREKRDALKEQLQELRDLADPKKTPEEIALQSMKTRLANNISDLADRLAREDYAARPKRPVVLDPEATRLKAENERLKKQFQRGVALEKLKARGQVERTGDWIVKWRRGFILSGPVTLAKLTSAAIQRMTLTPVEEGVGAVYAKLFPGVAERAPREGGLNVKAEARAWTQGLTQGMRDAWQTLKTGQSDLDVLYGKEALIPPSAADFFGHVHGALKAPTKRAEFARSLEKRTQQAIAGGVDVSDPLVQSRLVIESYKDANRAIFQQDNRVVSAYKRALEALERPDKATGKVPLAGKAAATAARVVMPIVKIPTNIVAETVQYATGLVTGSARLARAYRSGIENLKPEEADLIMRQLKKGSLGAAVLLLGYFNADVVGGYYQPGQKRKESDLKPGHIKLYGQDIPNYLLHNPLLETLQIGATIRRVKDSKLRQSDKENQGIGEGIYAAGLGLMEETPFVGETLGRLPKMLDPHQKGAFFGELEKSLAVPQAVQWTAQHFDTDAQGNQIKRQPRTTWEHVKSGVPGLRQTVPVAKKK